ncbi:MAG: 5'-nucleotidase C-terminal domain-containing protein [Myxococcaceae bacterium]
MRSMRLSLLALSLVLTACPEKKPAPAAPDASAEAPALPPVVTLLVTGSENGYLLPNPDDSGVMRGGAAQIMGRWVKDFGHCVGKVKEDGSPACKDGNTLVLSTGDNANGASISSFFDGNSASETMGAMGYAASAFGNRELDFGREGFVANRNLSGIKYLAANLTETEDQAKWIHILPYAVFERRGQKIGVIGLTARKTLKTVMPGRAAGLQLEDEETVLGAAAKRLWDGGASAVVLLSDDCLGEMKPVLEKHPEWKLAVVAGRQCEAEIGDKAGNTSLLYPGRHFNTFSVAKLTFDPSKPVAERLAKVETESVEVVDDDKAPAPEPKVAQVVNGWKGRRDAVLGQVIGHTKSGVEQTSDLMTKWIANALRGEPISADVGLVNRKGIRQSVPAGPITRATIYDVLPFENSVVVATLLGEDLQKVLENPEARAAGFTKKGKDWVDDKGKKLDPKKKYTLATTDYLYFGGDGFEIEKKDSAPNFTSQFWQTMVIDATGRLNSSEQFPLETKVK